MHLKNWSLLCPDRRRPVLSPGYDFVATLPYIPNDTLALSFGGSRSLADSGVFLAWRSGGGLNQWPTDRAFCLKASHGILRLSIRHPFGWPIVERSFGFAFLVHRYLYRRGVAERARSSRDCKRVSSRGRAWRRDGE